MEGYCRDIKTGEIQEDAEMITDLFDGVTCPHCEQQSEDYERIGQEEHETYTEYKLRCNKCKGEFWI